MPLAFFFGPQDGFGNSRLFVIIVIVVKVAQLCLTLCDPMDDCNIPGSSVYGILQARIQERIAIPFSRVSSQPGDQTQVSRIAGEFFTS